MNRGISSKKQSNIRNNDRSFQIQRPFIWFVK